VLYALLKALSGISLRWFYSRVDAEGLEKIPAGPVLLAVNHPNALVDSLVVAWVCPRRIRFTGNAQIFKNPIQGAFLRAAGAVPLIRKKDIAEVHSAADAWRNKQAFDELTNALRGGSAVMIFPEGITGDHPSLAPLRTGTARIALQARDAGVRSLAIVPVGLTFERKDTPRSRAFVQVGDPIDIETWPRSSDDSDVRMLTDELERRMRAVTLNYESLDAAAQTRALASQLARLIRGTHTTPEVWQPFAPLADQVAIARRIEELRTRLGVAPDPVRHRVDTLLQRLSGFREALARDRVMIEDLEISLGVPEGTWFVVRELPVALVAGPFALWGWLNHLIPFNVAQVLALRDVESGADPAMRTILNGIGLALLFYVLQGGVVVAVWGWLPAALYLVSLPIAADVNFYLRARLTRVVRRARAYLRFRGDRELRATLTRELEWLRAEALAVDALL
jgi:1-acyl-sn-glycerol-3-phosphate acyltransferase